MYERIYAVVRRIPRGQVASYGQIAKIAGKCSARNVGYAMSSLRFDSDVPWHRVINSRGMVSPRKDGNGNLIQRQMLETEGIVFNATGRVNLGEVGWHENEDDFLEP